MSDLPISGELDVTVNQASVRSAKQEIEDEVDDLALDINVSGEGRGRGGNIRGREQAMSRRLLTEGNKIQSSILEEIELIQENVDEIADAQGGGGGLLGGDGGIVAELFGAGAETAGDAAVETGDQFADTITNTISNAVGNTIADAITGNSVSVENTPLDVEETTLTVDDPSPLAISDPSPLSVVDPSPLSVRDPSPLAVEDPGTVSVDVDTSDREPLPVERDPLPVEAVEVTVNMSGSSGRSSDVPPAGGRVSLAQPGVGHYVRDNIERGGDTVPVAGQAVGALYGLGRGIGAQLPGGAGGLDREAAGFRGNPESQEQYQTILQQRRDQFFTSEESYAESQGQNRSAAGATNSVTVNQNVSVDIDGSRLRDRIISETESMIADLQRQIDQLERDITG